MTKSLRIFSSFMTVAPGLSSRGGNDGRRISSQAWGHAKRTIEARKSAKKKNTSAACNYGKYIYTFTCAFFAKV